ncbi:hypothetical protein PISMIDRAFT_113294 [Pisolithus microcarpus 441]|uniref:Uncharacterized protein n=1 Tax=Pisolithus microcarpus 441 TaxID=765257 RepID=A0A0C9Z981_9AGAM|nr:hypothetical protein PISMIDRAFT_113294 [Pisolithus microcarpus 441]
MASCLSLTSDYILAFQFSNWYPSSTRVSPESTIIRPPGNIFVPDGSGDVFAGKKY